MTLRMCTLCLGYSYKVGWESHGLRFSTSAAGDRLCHIKDVFQTQKKGTKSGQEDRQMPEMVVLRIKLVSVCKVLGVVPGTSGNVSYQIS